MKKIPFDISWLKKLRSKKDPQEPVINAPFSPETLLKTLGVEIYYQNHGEASESTIYNVGFQGGSFQLIFSANHLKIVYPQFNDCTSDDYPKYLYAANQVNESFFGWTCFLHRVSSGTDENEIKVSLSQMMPIHGTLDEVAQSVRSMMSFAFTVAREFNNRVGGPNRSRQYLDYFFNSRTFQNKLLFHQRMMETENLYIGQKEPAVENELCAGTILQIFDVYDFGQMKQMSIINEGKMVLLDDEEQINHFDFKAYIFNHPEREKLDNICFIMTFEKQQLMLNMKKLTGSTEKTYFFQCNATRSGLCDEIADDDTFFHYDFVVDIRLNSENEDYWEVKYLLDDAIEKQNSGQQKELSDEQNLMLSFLSSSNRSSAYWGKKYYDQKAYLQALYFFRQIYTDLSIKDLSENEEMKLHEVEQYIGSIYMEMKQYEKAFYYLNRAISSNHSTAIKAFIICLNRMKDPDASTFIRNTLQQTRESLWKMLQKGNDIDDENEYNARDTDEYNATILFYIFLYKSLVNAYLIGGDVQAARESLNLMIQQGLDPEYARNELKRIENFKDKHEE